MNKTTKLKDYYKNPLRDGLYFAGDGREGDLYFIEVSIDGKRFLAESCGGFIPVEDFELFAKQLIPVKGPHQNLEFAISRTLDEFPITKT